ncbi:DUF4406 domain-containing protein [Alicyclobacillus fastidiosus]|uniref:DUF4406 domain-containing protein n=1 Tax=Alicyclobacillus fastidiosus TaxID=392011 RepID=A0ABV5AKG7_9BACL|nr:DUF4406 domain-containing protein [Alicyclobacillus fastidiosus]WEH12107.1 DUF4406 domain-containing protein [Alicyclobacillus fastidiosus]
MYISGPMSGLPNFNRLAFNVAAKALRDAGHEVFNPAELDIPDGTWGHYMREALKGMLDCDHVMLLPGWGNSTGAKIEVDLARRLNIPVQSFFDWMCWSEEAQRIRTLAVRMLIQKQISGYEYQAISLKES